MDNVFSSYKIDDRSYVAFIKREIHNLVTNAGFSQHRAAEVDIVVSELASNLIKYAEAGEFLYRLVETEGNKELQLYCFDNGIGIDNVERIVNDGFSTSNTLGHGIGSIKRMSNDFQIYSKRNWGTVQYVRICEKEQKIAPPKNFDFAVIQTNIPGELVCGDGYLVKHTTNGFQIFVGDGLGHGQHANTAVTEAIKTFRISRETDPVEIIRDIHSNVRKTRGLVATIAVVNYKNSTWSICGVGNISTKIFTGIESKTYTPYNGIIGNNIPRTINQTVLKYEKHQMIIMHSDGIRSRWSITEMMSLLKQKPQLIAASLYKDHVRGNDDSTVFVGKTF